MLFGCGQATQKNGAARPSLCSSATMSRLFIKGLPPKLTNKELHDYVEQSGFTVSDAQVMHKPDGTSRGFGFVGLQAEGQAAEARKSLHHAFLHGSRLVVAPAKEMDLNATHEPRSKRRKINNDAAAQKQAVTQPLALPTQADIPQPDEQEESAQDSKATDAAVSDAEYFASRLKRKLGDNLEPVHEPAQEAQQTANEEQAAEEPEEEEEEQSDLVKTILQTGRLFLRNLAYHATADQITSHFAPFGPSTLHLPSDPSRSNTGVAYLHFQNPQDAVKAHQALDGRPFLGRLVHVLPSVDRFTPAQPLKFEADPKKKPKAQQDNAQRNNKATLVANTDAVAASLAARLGLDKRDVLDPTASSSAVKLALAETSVLDETRRYCAKQGIDLDVLSNPSIGPKSATVILLKNLPAGTTQTTVQNLVAQFGEVRKLAVPPSAALAFVDFKDAQSAKSALKALSYQKLGNSVIYVEKMPAALWHDQPLDSAAGAQNGEGKDADEVAFNPEDQMAVQETPQESQTPSSTLFVQNIPFTTPAEAFERLFRSLAGFVYARMQTKKGFGFVGFKSVEQAQAAKSKMDGALLDGRPLKLQFSTRSGDEDEEHAMEEEGRGGSKKKKWSTKLIVKNVPFEASAKDLRQLFSAVSTLKSLRLPKRADRRSRGFAFVEFASSKDAAAAAQMLKHTHLLGRHLVLEESAEEEKPGIDYL